MVTFGFFGSMRLNVKKYFEKKPFRKVCSNVLRFLCICTSFSCLLSLEGHLFISSLIDPVELMGFLYDCGKDLSKFYSAQCVFFPKLSPMSNPAFIAHFGLIKESLSAESSYTAL